MYFSFIWFPFVTVFFASLTLHQQSNIVNGDADMMMAFVADALCYFLENTNDSRREKVLLALSSKMSAEGALWKEKSGKLDVADIEQIFARVSEWRAQVVSKDRIILRTTLLLVVYLFFCKNYHAARFIYFLFLSVFLLFCFGGVHTVPYSLLVRLIWWRKKNIIAYLRVLLWQRKLVREEESRNEFLHDVVRRLRSDVVWKAALERLRGQPMAVQDIREEKVRCSVS